MLCCCVVIGVLCLVCALFVVLCCAMCWFVGVVCGLVCGVWCVLRVVRVTCVVHDCSGVM